ncbi:hypothetical protein ZOSMA_235G00280 [Zostera marina]|uniref:Amidase domain-containing protein n=1 Tax=Zostera marina TaxID=29655 RepID=A0A0K9PI58_ZOSMR|nr:hypothetical protein ZOSMA_235G00280 [Zostera marina]
MKLEKTDASSILAIGGYPAISVPESYGQDGVHFGISFGGLLEPKLIEIAFAFEQATMVRVPHYHLILSNIVTHQ